MEWKYPRSLKNAATFMMGPPWLGNPEQGGPQIKTAHYADGTEPSELQWYEVVSTGLDFKFMRSI